MMSDKELSILFFILFVLLKLLEFINTILHTIEQGSHF
jgi:hypothetical protein